MYLNEVVARNAMVVGENEIVRACCGNSPVEHRDFPRPSAGVGNMPDVQHAAFGKILNQRSGLLILAFLGNDDVEIVIGLVFESPQTFLE